MSLRIKEIEASSILVESNLPDTDYVVNPYTGCEFGCHYCYASFMGRFVGEPIQAWGQYLYVKTNAVDVLRADLKKLPASKRHSTVFLSSVTDPYQGAEAKYALTRGILETFADEAYPGTLSLLTKSGMVKRDIDLLSRLPSVDVGMTITTTDDALGRFMEVKAPRASIRLQTLRLLTEAGLPTYAFIGPLFPHYRYKKNELQKLFQAVAETGVREIYCEHINCKPYILERLQPALAREPAYIQKIYQEASLDEHRAALDEMVLEFVDQYHLKLRLGGVLYHGQKRSAALA